MTARLARVWPWCLCPLIPFLLGMPVLMLLQDDVFNVALSHPPDAIPLRPEGQFRFFADIASYVALALFQIIGCRAVIVFFVQQLRGHGAETRRDAVGSGSGCSWKPPCLTRPERHETVAPALRWIEWSRKGCSMATIRPVAHANLAG